MNYDPTGPGFCRTCHSRYQRERVYLPRTACSLHREKVGFCQICRVDYDIPDDWTLKTVCPMHRERGHCRTFEEIGVNPEYELTPHWQMRIRCPRHGVKKWYYCESCDEEYEWTDDDRVWWFEGFHCPRGCEGVIFPDDDQVDSGDEEDDDDDDEGMKIDENDDEEMDMGGRGDDDGHNNHCRRGDIRRGTRRCEACGKKFYLTPNHQVDELCQICINAGVLDQEGEGLCNQCHRLYELEDDFPSEELCKHCAVRNCDYCREDYLITDHWLVEDVCERCANEMAENPPRTNECENCSESYEIDDVYNNEQFCPRCEDSQTRLIGQPGLPDWLEAASRYAVKALLGKKLDNTMIGAQDLAEGEDPACAICRRDVKMGTKVRVLRCRHWFHGSCIRIWLEGSSRKCPSCRRPIPEPSRDHKMSFELRLSVRRARRAARQRARRARADRRILAGSPVRQAARLPARRLRSSGEPEDPDYVDEEEASEEDMEDSGDLMKDLSAEEAELMANQQGS